MRLARLSFRERRGAAIHASPNSGRHWLRRLIVACLASLFLALGGAFGTGSAPLGPRVAFWLLTICVGSLIGGAISDAIGRLGWPAGRWAACLCGAAASTVPTALAIWTLETLFFAGGRFQSGLLGQLLPPVLLINFAISALNALARHPPAQTPAAPLPSAPLPPQSGVRLLDRLPAKLKGAELWAIEAEDHYLRLHTSRGSDLILLRLADAMAELEGMEGAQTHRSWWVARSAVEGARPAEGRATLLLKGGLQAPVSRTRVRALRQLGWF
jgi:hypothetical protein